MNGNLNLKLNNINKKEIIKNKYKKIKNYFIKNRK